MVFQIPTITYGGPKVAPEQPPAEAVELHESLVILEFLVDLYPTSGLLPADPVLRAKARLFIAHFETTVFAGFKAFVILGESANALLDALDALQHSLPATDGYAIGATWCIADMVVSPFLVRLEMFLQHELGRFAIGEGKKTLEVLKSEKFARYDRYIQDIKNHPVFKTTWDEVRVYGFIHSLISDDAVAFYVQQDTQVTIWTEKIAPKRE
jgi:glutathione S-transferase